MIPGPEDEEEVRAPNTSGGWRECMGVEPTCPSTTDTPVLKTGRPTGAYPLPQIASSPAPAAVKCGECSPYSTTAFSSAIQIGDCEMSMKRFSSSRSSRPAWRPSGVAAPAARSTASSNHSSAMPS